MTKTYCITNEGVMYRLEDGKAKKDKISLATIEAIRCVKGFIGKGEVFRERFRMLSDINRNIDYFSRCGMHYKAKVLSAERDGLCRELSTIGVK
jgi:hypothetical protein